MRTRVFASFDDARAAIEWLPAGVGFTIRRVHSFGSRVLLRTISPGPTWRRRAQTGVNVRTLQTAEDLRLVTAEGVGYVFNDASR